MTKHGLDDTTALRDRPVEITPAMLSAGVDAYLGFILEDERPETVVTEIYQQMRKAAR